MLYDQTSNTDHFTVGEIKEHGVLSSIILITFNNI
jgi:hypothetical protein